jgi:hypothetical protein
MYLKRHSLRERIIEGFLLSLLFLDSCTDKHAPGEYVARVNDSYLTREELSEIVDTTHAVISKEEAISRWVQKEVLYQAAVNEGIIDDPKFKEIIENSRKELAGAFLLQRYSSGETFSYTPQELEQYYKANHSSFILSSDAYYLNRVSFKDHNNAIEFRTDAISNGWSKAINEYKNDPSLVFINNNILINKNDIYPARVSRVVNGLYPLEISIVISDDAGYYTVVQVLEIYTRGSVPPYNIVKNKVEKRYLAELKKAAVEKYLEELYSKIEIEINN